MPPTVATHPENSCPVTTPEKALGAKSIVTDTVPRAGTIPPLLAMHWLERVVTLSEIIAAHPTPVWIETSPEPALAITKVQFLLEGVHDIAVAARGVAAGIVEDCDVTVVVVGIVVVTVVVTLTITGLTVVEVLVTV
jgi:hypothetical protein